MVPTVLCLPRNWRFILLSTGLVFCLVALWDKSFRRGSSVPSSLFCLLDGCRHFVTINSQIPSNKAELSAKGSSLNSPVQGLGGSGGSSNSKDNTNNSPSPSLVHSHSPPSSLGTTIIDLSLPDGPFVPWPLARVCSERTTRRQTTGPLVVFVCDNNSGGIGNIRNFILTCLRYAIEASAQGIVLPTIQTRNEERLGDLFRGQRVPFGHFFDDAWFREGLRDACPDFVVYDDLRSVPGQEDGEGRQGDGKEETKKKRPAMITPKHFGMRGGCDARDLNRHTNLFGPRFHAWLAEREEHEEKQRQQQHTTTRLIRFNWGVQWEWPVHGDGPEFVATFGGLLRFRADILELGKKTAEVLVKGGKGEEGFLGMHLRTENDALSNWPSFDEQAHAYLARASTMSPRLAYVATGNATEAARFTTLARQQQQLRVVTKHQLLQEANEQELLRQLDQLSWDQQALVDFVVLLHAEFFVGVSPSSFSMNVALKRHLWSEGVYTRPWRVGSEEGDGRSWLVGRYENYWEDWLFMYDSLWP